MVVWPGLDMHGPSDSPTTYKLVLDSTLYSNCAALLTTCPDSSQECLSLWSLLFIPRLFWGGGGNSREKLAMFRSNFRGSKSRGDSITC